MFYSATMDDKAANEINLFQLTAWPITVVKYIWHKLSFIPNF